MLQLTSPFPGVEPTTYERLRKLPSDVIIAQPECIIDRGMTLTGSATDVRSWLVQIGPRQRLNADGSMLLRGGWYLTKNAERLLPKRSRGLRHIDPSMTMEVGQQFRDWAECGTPRWITVHEATATSLVLTGTRGATDWSWAFALDELGNTTRLHTRFRMSPIRIKGHHHPMVRPATVRTRRCSLYGAVPSGVKREARAQVATIGKQLPTL